MRKPVLWTVVLFVTLAFALLRGQERRSEYIRVGGRTIAIENTAVQSAAPGSFVVNSVPPGRDITLRIVEGSAVTTVNRTTPLTVIRESGKVYELQIPGPEGLQFESNLQTKRYRFTGWADNAPVNPVPSSTTSVTAVFETQVMLQLSAIPLGAATHSLLQLQPASPAWYNAGAQVDISTSDLSGVGYSFVTWAGVGAVAAPGFALNARLTRVVLSDPASLVATYQDTAAPGPGTAVQIRTVPNKLKVLIDGGDARAAAIDTAWAVGSSHTVQPIDQQVLAGSPFRYDFSRWVVSPSSLGFNINPNTKMISVGPVSTEPIILTAEFTPVPIPLVTVEPTAAVITNPTTLQNFEVKQNGSFVPVQCLGLTGLDGVALGTLSNPSLGICKYEPPPANQFAPRKMEVRIQAPAPGGGNQTIVASLSLAQTGGTTTTSGAIMSGSGTSQGVLKVTGTHSTGANMVRSVDLAILKNTLGQPSTPGSLNTTRQAPNFTASNGCFLSYDPLSSFTWLADDNGTAWAGAGLVGSLNTLANGRCSVDLAPASSELQALTAVVTYPIRFSPLMQGSSGAYGITLAGSPLAWSNWSSLGLFTVPDTTPPVISNYSATVNGTTATITWRTNEAASSRIEYWLPNQAAPSTKTHSPQPHAADSTQSLILTGTDLLPAQVYNYRIVSTDVVTSPATPNTSSVTGTFTTGSPIPNFLTRRINIGGAAIPPGWEPESGCSGGTSASVTNTIQNAGNFTPQQVYQTQLQNMTSCQFAVPDNQAYEVVLKFAETSASAAGQRRFHVSLNGVQVLTGFDVFAAAQGQFKAIEKRFVTSSRSGLIDVRFTGVTGAPVLNGIEIIPSQAVRVTGNAAPGAVLTSGGFTWNNAEICGGATRYPALTQPVAGSDLPGFPAAYFRVLQPDQPSNPLTCIQGGLSPGGYMVTLKFAELFSGTAVGGRMFNISINDVQVRTGFDPLAAAVAIYGQGNGLNKPVDLTFPVYLPEGTGQIKIELRNTRVPANNPTLNAFEIVPASNFPRRVLAGRTISHFNTATGKFWAAEEGVSGGVPFLPPAQPIAGSEDPVPYQQQRYGPMRYSFPVPPGDYKVTLHFAELFYSQPDARGPFNVRINGTEYLTYFRVAAPALNQPKPRINQAFNVRVGTSSLIDLEFAMVSPTGADNPIINAIEIEPADAGVAPQTRTIVDFTIAPGAVTGGASGSATAVVTLSETGSAAASVCFEKLQGSSAANFANSCVAIPANSVSGSASITTSAVPASQPYVFKATLGASSRSAPLTVNPSLALSISDLPPSAQGGSSVGGVVNINVAQPQPVTVSLSSSNPAVATLQPAVVTIPANLSSASFTLNASAVSQTQTATITAASAGITAGSRVINITSGTPALPAPIGWWKLDETGGNQASDSSSSLRHGIISGTPSRIVGQSGQALNFNGNFTLEVPPPASGTPDVLKNVTSVTVSAWVKPGLVNDHKSFVAWDGGSSNLFALRIKDGGSAGPGVYFDVATNTFPYSETVYFAKNNWASQWYHVAGTFDNATKAFRLYLDGAQVATRILDANQILVPYGWGNDKFWIGSDGPDYRFIGAVDEVRVYNEALTASQISTLAGVTPSVSIQSVSVSPATVTGGQSSTGTVTLSANAPTGGAVVTLSSSQASATVPATVTVPAGSSSATFNITTTPVAANQSATITATYSGTATATLTVNRPIASTVTLNPVSVTGGTSSTGTVTISGPAPTGGAVVTLSSSITTAATVPANVTIAAGASSANFTVTTLTVAASQSPVISATYNVTATATLTVTPPSGAPTNGLVGWWKLDEGSGTSTADSGPNALPGDLQGTTLPSWVPGRSGGHALRFNGSNRVSLGSANVLKNMTSVTVSAWIKPGLTNDHRTFVCLDAGSWNLYGLRIKDSGSSSPGIYLDMSFSDPNSGPELVFLKNDWTSTQWYLVTGTYDAATKTMKLYLGDTLVQSQVFTDNRVMFPFGSNHSAWIGSDNTVGFDGTVDDVRIYNRALTQAEVTSLLQ